MQQKFFPMTITGEQRLKEELFSLKTVARPTVIQRIAEARAHGDLRENGDYHAARDEQSFIEGRILELESKLSNAQVIDVSKIPNQGKVIFGATVSLVNLQNNMKITYQIVGEDESDIKSNKISVTSPLARAMIGKAEGDEITVNAPGGAQLYEIEAVQYI